MYDHHNNTSSMFSNAFLISDMYDILVTTYWFSNVNSLCSSNVCVFSKILKNVKIPEAGHKHSSCPARTFKFCLLNPTNQR